MNRKTIATLLLAASLGAATTARAGIYTDDLSRCLVASSSTEDNDVLMRWLFSAMTVNPAVKSLTTLSAEQRDTYSRQGAALVQRLVTGDCHKETVAALKYEGLAAFAESFRVLGGVAARGLMSEPTTQAQFSGFTRYFDQAKWNALGEEAGLPKGDLIPAAKK